MPTWCIIDTSCLTWQEFYGAAGTDPVASITGGVARGLRLAEELGCPDRTVWCLDRGPYLRATLLPGYKASRTDSPEKAALRALSSHLPELLAVLGHRNIRCHPGYEADDHVAVATRQLPPGDTAVIISRDKDLHQLINTRVSQLDPVTKLFTTLSQIRAQYGLHPSELADVRAIAGCSTDEVPGVAGVGEITAAKFVRGDLNKLGATWGKISAFVRSAVHERNTALVRLPYPETPIAPLTPDVAHRMGSWDEFVQAVGKAAIDRHEPGSGRHRA